MRRSAVILVITSLAGCATAIPLDDSYDAGGCQSGKAGASVDSGVPDTEVPDADTEAPAEPDTGTREDTAIADTAPPSTGDVCSDCLYAKCGPEVSACFSDAACTDLMTCLNACFDDACASACFTKYPSPAYEKFAICGQSRCEAQCL